MTLGLTAVPGLLVTPTDIVLVLDNSESSQPQLLEQMKTGARNLVDQINFALGGQHFDPLPGGNCIGVVSFAGQAVANMNLTNETIMVEAGITELRGGEAGTNYALALQWATETLASSTGQKVIILYTYTAATDGDAAAAAKAARDQGIQIFGLGPELRRADLNAWASKPSSYHVYINVGGEQMNVPFQMAGNRIIEQNTLGAALTSVIPPDFEFVGVISASQGTATSSSSQAVAWNIGDLGVTKSETATLIYEIRHKAGTLGGEACHRRQPGHRHRRRSEGDR